MTGFVSSNKRSGVPTNGATGSADDPDMSSGAASGTVIGLRVERTRVSRNVYGMFAQDI